jgi:DNA-binding MurR/RpiR family transcriptional regulator
MNGPVLTGSCLERIRGRLRDQPNSARKVADFIMDSPREARALSIEALAAVSGASTATISRFCKHLGYGGYREFQLDLTTAVAQPGIVEPDELAPGTDPATLVAQVFEASRQSLTETERLVRHEVLTAVAQMMRKAARAIFVGLGDSAMTARHAAERCLSLGFNAVAFEDPYLQIFATANVGAKDVVVGISHTGLTASVIEAVVKARRRGAHTVAITNYPGSPLAKAAELVLTTAAREHRIRAGVSSSAIPQFCIIDAIYFLLRNWAGKGAKDQASETEKRVQTVLRNPRAVAPAKTRRSKNSGGDHA